MFCNPSRQFGIREMNIADVLSGHAKLKGIRWVLGSSTAHEVLRDRLRGLLPTGFQLGPCRLREVQFKLRRRLTACYDVLVQKEGSDAKYVRPIAVSWGSSRSTDGQEETDVLAKVQAEAVSRGVAAPFRSEEHTSELQSRVDLVCRLLLEKKKYTNATNESKI